MKLKAGSRAFSAFSLRATHLKVYVSSLSETSIFTAIQHFDFLDGNLGMGLSGKLAAGSAYRPSVRKRTFNGTPEPGFPSLIDLFLAIEP